MKMLSIEQELKNNSYPGRGIVIGKSADGPLMEKRLSLPISLWDGVKIAGIAYLWKREKGFIHRRLIRQS